MEDIALRTHLQAKQDEMAIRVTDKQKNLNRLEDQLREAQYEGMQIEKDLSLLKSEASSVGEIIKTMSRTQVLVKVLPDGGRYVVEFEPHVDINHLAPKTRVALRPCSMRIHQILPDPVDPLVAMMRVEKVPDCTYDMLGGLEQQVRDIKEVVELPLKHPELFQTLGIAPPKGILLYGPPGTGKTALARAVAHHCGCEFFRLAGTELAQRYIGTGAYMIRQLFAMARKHAPAIIFIDEVDSICSARIDSVDGDREAQRTLLELLNQLDGFEPIANIKVIMATNRVDILDPSLLRAGRLDRKIEFPPPDELGRLQVLRIHSRQMNLARDVNLQQIAEMTDGASGAEMKAVCMEAGLYALRERRVVVAQEDFDMAVAKALRKGDQHLPTAMLFGYK